MSLNIYSQEDIRNTLKGIAMARGLMGDEAAQVLEAVAAGFGIQPETIGVERYVVTLEDIQRITELRNRP